MRDGVGRLLSLRGMVRAQRSRKFLRRPKKHGHNLSLRINSFVIVIVLIGSRHAVTDIHDSSLDGRLFPRCIPACEEVFAEYEAFLLACVRQRKRGLLLTGAEGT